MKVALTITADGETLCISKQVRNEEELNQALNFFKRCEVSLDGEEIETDLNLIGGTIKIPGFLNLV